jgi:hypothetical protein
MTKYVYALEKCPYCDEVRKSTGLHKHVKTHGEELYRQYQDSKKIESKSTKLDNGMFKCIECSFEGKTIQSVSSHWWRNHTSDGKSHSSIEIGSKYADDRVAWNKGLSKETDERVKLLSEKISNVQQEQIKNGTYIPRKMGNKAAKELSERQSLHNSGGKSKWYEVNGVKVQGTWERNVAIKLCEMGIEWSKPSTNTDLFKYIMGGKEKSYAPDFYLPKYDTYLEIKGYWWGNDREKMDLVIQQHPTKKIVIVEKDGYEKILQGELVWSFQRPPEERKN